MDVGTELREGPTADVVVVTGASRGIGLEVALTLAGCGFHVWATTRRPEHGERVLRAASARGVTLRTVQLEVTDPASVESAIACVRETSGVVYGVVNNAGVKASGYFEDLRDHEIRRIFDVNLFGAMNVTRAVLPMMREARRGRVVMLSSICGRIGSLAASAYVSSKFALEGFSESLSMEVRPFGIDVSLIESGVVPTDMVDVNTDVAVAANDASSPYYRWFRRAQSEMEEVVRTSTIVPADVAEAVRRAMTYTKPRLRYTVGSRARMLMSLRRHLPGEMFERFYFGEVIRRVTR